MIRHLLIALLATLNAAASFGAKPLPIIPAPTTMEETSDKTVRLKLPLDISIGEVDSLSHEVIEREVKNISTLLPQKHQDGAEISFSTDTLQPAEGYRLTIDGRH